MRLLPWRSQQLRSKCCQKQRKKKNYDVIIHRPPSGQDRCGNTSRNNFHYIHRGRMHFRCIQHPLYPHRNNHTSFVPPPDACTYQIKADRDACDQHALKMKKRKECHLILLFTVNSDVSTYRAPPAERNKNLS